jgi:uncharacterized repeat protein (TIGR01451 family)
LTGATSTAGGTVTYRVYTNSTCSTLAASQISGQPPAVTVTNAAVPNSGAVTFLALGTFYWQAVYSGDTNNNGATSPCTSEPVIVSTPFSCTTPTGFMSENVPSYNSRTQMYSANYGAGTVTFTALGAQSTLSYNALGFNPNDNFLYGIQIGTNHLVGIDSSGTATDLGAVTGLPSPTGGLSPAYFTGAFDGENAGAHYWVTRGVTSANPSSTTKTAYEIDIPTKSVINTLTLSQNYDPADFTADPAGFLWGAENGSRTIDRLDLSTGTVTSFTLPTSITPNSYWGAAFTLSNGNIVIASNGNGNIYQIAIANPASSNPTFTVVSQYSGRTTSANDGAECVAKPVDLSIAKTGPATVSPGGTITWTITVTNNGPGNSSGFVVNDAVPANVTKVTSTTSGCTVTGNTVACNEGALPAAAPNNTFTITLAGVAPTTNGTCFTNTATVTGNESDPNSANNTSSLQTCTTPALTLVKSASVASFNAAGTAITYSYKVTNTGTSTTLNPVTVADPMPGLSAVTCPGTSLAPGASMTCTATYTTTQTNVDAGSITNTGTATFTPSSGPPVTATSTVTIPAVQNRAISIVKSANITGFSASGTAVTYSYRVTNTGNVTLNPVTVTDPMPGLSAISCPSTSLAPGIGETCTATYTTTQANVDAGSVANTGTSTGTAPNGATVTASSTLSIPASQNPNITLVKSANISTFAAAGIRVTYSYKVSNTGNVTLTSVGVTDPMPGLSAITCPSTMLAPGASQTCTAAYNTTQADVDAGAIHNTGTATGTPPSGPAKTAQSSVTIPAATTPSITLVKSSDVNSLSPPAAPGVVITYSYLVTNNGNVTLHSVGVTDPMPGLSSVSCPSATLAPGASETCTATYTTTQADIDAGSINNTGTASGTPPTGPPVTAQSSLTIKVTRSPAIGMTKTASVQSFSAVGTIITYSYHVVNSGNDTLTSVTVTDPMKGLSAVTCPQSTLAPGASETCTATYTTIQADIDAGAIHNTGTATGTPPTGANVTDSSSATVPATQSPAISIVKSASVPNFSTPGTLVTYSYLVKNTGNVTLHSVGVADPMTGLSSITCPSSTLMPGASETCTATYTTTQSNVDAGGITNTGTASGLSPSPANVPVNASSSLTISAVQSPSIALLKTANVPSFSAPGTVVTYSYRVTNTGNVTLSPVTVTDPMIGLSAITCPNSPLLPHTSEVCTATYTSTQADVDRGSINNTGTATGTPPTGPNVTGTSSVSIPAVQTRGISLTKTANVTAISAVGTVVTYSYFVTNTGNVTLNPVTVTDPMLGLTAIACPDTALAPGASETCTAAYTTTQADLDRGSVTNTGTATGTPPSGPPIDATNSVDIPVKQTPHITLVKTADVASFASAGTLITYSYDVTNDGNVTLNPVTVTDPKTGLSAIVCPDTALAPGTFETCTATYTTTTADLDAGGVANTGTATGTPPAGAKVSSSSTAFVPAILKPAIGILKTASTTTFSAPGTVITYSYKVTNSGNVTLAPVTVTDSHPGLSSINCGGVTSLAPGASNTCTATYTTTQADVDRGSISNTGTATGIPPSGPAITASASLTVMATQTPGITLAKTSDTPSYATPGVLITYHYRVTNTGNVTLNPVTVTDPMTNLSSIICPDTSLAPGGFETCTATYTTTQADVDNGSVTNTGTATGTPPSGAAVSSQATVTVPAVQNEAIGLVKTADISSFDAPGTTVFYLYTVSNIGNVDLFNVTVTDPMPGLSTIVCTFKQNELLVGTSATCQATYITTQADVDNGSITNTGTATGNRAGGPPISNTSTVTIPATQTPALTIAKTASLASFNASGQTINYNYLVTNTGDVTLSAVGVTDPMPGLPPVSCPTTVLAPGAQETCTATYTTTQIDVDRGSITNTGTATGTPPTGPPVTNTSTATVPAMLTPAIELAKSANPASYTSAGTVLTYSYTVINSGNVTLRAIAVGDPMTGLSAISCPPTTLAPQAEMVCTATYTTTQADVDKGSVNNAATVTGTTPSNTEVSNDATDHVPAQQTAAIGLVKSASPTSFSAPGTVITYSYTVTNTGNVTLTAVNVTDLLPGLSALSCPDPVLAPGAFEVCTATYTTTAADLDAGQVVNTATAEGTAPGGQMLTSLPASVTVPANQAAAIGLVKTASPSTFSATGTTITYSYKVTNSGNVTLNPVTVTDPMPNLSAISCPATSLAIGASETCTATYQTTQIDLNAGQITNTGTVTGAPPTGTNVTAQSTAIVRAAQTPNVTLVKSANPVGFSTVGTTITYSYKVTNTGNVTLDPVTVTDPMPGLSAIDCGTVTSLAPGDSNTCTATYSTTQVDLNRGNIRNTGTLTAQPPSGPALIRQSSATVLASQRPAIQIKKTPSIVTFAAAGTPVTYTYVVTNIGNVTLSPVRVTDPMAGLSGIDCGGITSLAPGDDETCTAAYTTTQANMDAGFIANTGTAVGTPPNGLPNATDQSSVVIFAQQLPGITLVKQASITGYSTPDIPVVYTYTVTNSGNVTLTSVNVTDPMPGLSAISCPLPTLPPGDSEHCTATYTTTQADVDRGSINNTGTATGTAPDGTSFSDKSSVTIPGTSSPGISLTKSSDISTFSSPGTLLIYHYLVTNTGNVTLTAVVVTDPMTGLSAISCPDSTLAPGQSETCTASYTVTQANVNAGGITNTGTATGTDPSGGTETAQSTLTIPLLQAPGISVDKSASVTSFSAPGIPITYHYLVTNSGNVTLSSIAVTDPQSGLSAVICPPAPLAPGSSEICAATYTTTQADVDRGGITNTGTASGVAPNGLILTDSSTLTVPSNESPAITLTKSADVASYSKPGTTITYSYVVTNIGNVTVTAVNVTDNLVAVSCPISPVAPGASVTCTASYKTTQDDVDNGQITNLATASAIPPTGPPPVTAPQSLTIPAVRSPSITLTKVANPGSFSSAGTVITYSYVVTNGGNVTLTAVDVIDPMPGLSPISCPQSELPPDSFETCTATYTTTQADMDRGSITNTGIATGTPPSGPPITSDSTATIPATQRAAIDIDKKANVTTYSAAGTVVTYSYTVTNIGNVTLDPVTVADPLPGLSPINCGGVLSLAPAASETCTATYTITQTDMDTGLVTNTGTATGSPPSGPPVTDTDTVTITATPAPSIELTKSASVNSFAAAGLPVTYSYLVTNNGNVTLDPVTVTDPMSGLSTISCEATSLAPGDSETCTATYTTTSTDVANGSISNTGTATGTSPQQTPVTDTSSVTIPLEAVPAIGIAKSANPDSVSAAGTTITYSYVVTNSGNVALNPVTVTDAMSGLSTISCPDTSLGLGATETCTATYTTTQADIDHGSITNTGTATGTPPSGNAVSAQSSTTVDAVQTAGVTLVKSATPSSFTAANTTITYNYLVTNTGNVTLSAVAVTDPMVGLSPIDCGTVTSLAPKATVTCHATYTTTQANVDAGGVSNTGTVSGTPPSGPPATDSSPLTVPAPPNPVITISKSATPTSFSAPGVLLTYHFTVTNRGNVTLDPVTVTDTMPGLSPISCPDTSLAPAAFETCTATYMTTQADLDAGGITNTASVSGTPPSGPPAKDNGTATTPAIENPTLTIIKSANIFTFSVPGVPVTYSYLVTNTGNVTLNPVTVTDAMPGLSAISCPATSLAPAAFESCTATYTTTQADVDAGSIDNTGTATGTPPSGTPISKSAPLSIPAQQAPAIDLLKSADVSSFASAGQIIHYDYKVTNAGNVTLNPVAVTDPMTGLSAISCPGASLAPGATMTCTATYTTTQADVDNHGISNTGTATGTLPDESTIDDSATLLVPAIQSPSIAIEKSASPDSYSAPNTTITYSYLVTNTGNETLDPVTVTDRLPGLSSITCPDTSLAPAAFETCTATYSTTQGDVDRGIIVNSATATGTPPGGPPMSSAPSTVTVPANQTSGIDLTKTADPTSFDAAGQTITYTFTVKNTGNVTLDSVTVIDPMPGLSSIDCPETTLAPSQSEACTATYITIQADVDRGFISNTATAHGNPPPGLLPDSDPATFTVTANQAPDLSVAKSASPVTFSTAGTEITYSYVVTNTGNVTLDPVTVTDPMPRLSAISCPNTSLAPAAFETCTATYTTTQADVDAGEISNTATATGTPPSGPPKTSDPSNTVTVPTAELTIKKSASITNYEVPGVPVIYSYEVTNTGQATITDLTVTDPMSGLSAIDCGGITTLAPGAPPVTCTATYTTTPADVQRGSITNTGTATGTPDVNGTDGPPISADSSATIPGPRPAITLAKSGSISSYSAPGVLVTYSYHVTNTGNVTLNPVTVTDPMPGLSAISCPSTSLAPAASETCTATYTTTQTDVDVGSLKNTGTASGTPPSGPPVTAHASLAIDTALRPGLTLLKSASVSSFSGAGTTVTYSYKVTNTGNVTMHDIRVTDPMPGLAPISCPASTLAPGASLTCTATYTTTEQDVVNGKVTNAATASATDPRGTLTTSTPSVVTVPMVNSPAPSSPPPAKPTPITSPPLPVTG